jgi:hypothetical protein
VDFLLVLRVPGSSIFDRAKVIGIEQQVSAALGDIGMIAGHDSGSGETDVLIMTRKPMEAYNVLRGLKEISDQPPVLKASYRQLAVHDYEVVYKQESFRFHIA